MLSADTITNDAPIKTGMISSLMVSMDPKGESFEFKPYDNGKPRNIAAKKLIRVSITIT